MTFHLIFQNIYHGVVVTEIISDKSGHPRCLLKGNDVYHIVVAGVLYLPGDEVLLKTFLHKLLCFVCSSHCNELFVITCPFLFLAINTQTFRHIQQL